VDVILDAISKKPWGKGGEGVTDEAARALSSADVPERRVEVLVASALPDVVVTVAGHRQVGDARGAEVVNADGEGVGCSVEQLGAIDVGRVRKMKEAAGSGTQ
jgi:hypothetical protein